MGASVRKLWKLVTRASAQSQQTRPRLCGAFLMAAADLAWRIPAGGIIAARKRSLLGVPYRSSAAVVSPSGTPGSNLPWLLPSIGRALLFLCQALPHTSAIFKRAVWLLLDSSAESPLPSIRGYYLFVIGYSSVDRLH